MGTISKMVPRSTERFRQKQMKLDEMTKPGWEDAADYSRERGKKYGTSELRVAAVIQPQMNHDTAAPAPTTYGELMKCLEIIPGISQTPQRTSRAGRSFIRLGSVQLQSNTNISGIEPTAECDTSSLLIAKPVEPVSFYPCI